MPVGHGLLPAFWMLPNDYDNWPVHGEIDIVELIGQEVGTIHGTVHYGEDAINEKEASGIYSTPNGLNSGFHIYKVVWTPEDINFYYDSINYFTANSSNVNPWVFEGNKFYMGLNLAIGGDWAGPPNNDTNLPQEMLVDYVRVYQLKTSTTSDEDSHQEYEFLSE